MWRDPHELFNANLPVIDRACRRVAAKAGLSPEDAEDLASETRLALLENDCAILRQWEGRASLATFLIIIAQRVLADRRRREHGKWRPSAQAQRMGEAAVTLERLVRRNGRSVDEALPAVRDLDPSMTAESARAIIERLPDRAPPPRLVALDPELEVAATDDAADGRAAAAEARRVSEKTSAVMRRAIEAMPLEDRSILRLRFASGLPISSIARMLRLPQRPLYRRLGAIIAGLRSALRRAGIDARTVDELIGSPLDAMDFGPWKTDQARTADQMEPEAGKPEERWP
jgi:RNA polymerase sigma factor (sigma-70 family)